MVKRYELTDAQWVRIEGLLMGKPGDPDLRRARFRCSHIGITISTSTRRDSSTAARSCISTSSAS